MLNKSLVTPIANILVIDDNPLGLTLLQEILNQAGYKVRLLSDPTFAFQCTKTQQPDLILLDVNMPEMDGYTVCTQLKTDPLLQNIPVIFISALDEVINKSKAFTAGAVDYITKPFHSEEVVARVQLHLNHARLQKQLEQQNQQLQKEQERWELVLEGTGDGIFDWTIATGEIVLSRQLKEMLGYPNDVIVISYTEWVNLIHPNDQKRVLNVLRSYLQHIEPVYNVEYRICCQNGNYKWVLGRGKAQWDEEENAIRMIGSLQDISIRKQQEATLKEANRRWQSLLQNVKLLVISLDQQGYIEYANPFFLEITGHELSEVVGKKWFENFLVPSEQAETWQIFQEMLHQYQHPHHQNTILSKLGEEYIIAWSNTILQDLQGNIRGIISIGEDVTERVRLENLKAEFISIVSHELRTPLTSIYGALDLLDSELVDPASQRGRYTIKVAMEGAERLTRLVNDILDLDRLESARIKLEKQHCITTNLLFQATAQMQSMADQAGVSLQIETENLIFYADPDRILQVLTNLLNNAIKFSSEGSSVWLSAEIIDEKQTTISSQRDSSESYILFSVQDQGRGIPETHLEKIFERFHQVDPSDARQKGGTGLGLAIARSIVTQHGGRIWAKNRAEGGSCFSFTIPM